MINTCAWTTIAVGVLVCLGWAGNIAVLKSVFPSQSTMKVNTALSFILSGISLLTVPYGRINVRRHLSVGLACATGVAAVACLILAEYAFLIDLGIDQFFVHDPVDSVATRFPGRMALVTAGLFLLSSTTLTLIHLNRGPRLAQVLTVLVFFTASLCCLSYLYGAKSLHSIASFSPIAVHTAISFLIFSMGLLSALPKMGLVALIAGDGVGGVLIRQLLPIAIIGPVLMGWIRLGGQQAGWYGTEFGSALFASFSIMLCSGLVCWTALIVQRSDFRRRLADEAFRASERRFRVIVEATPSGLLLVDHQGRIILANSPMEKLFGYAQSAFVGMAVEQLIPERYRAHHPEFRAQYFANPQSRSMGSGQDLRGLRRDGSEFAIEIGLSPVETEGKLFVLASVNDITFRKEADQALRMSERRYRVLLEGVPQQVWTCLQNGQCDYLSRQWTDYTGIPERDHLGNGWLNAVHPEDLAYISERWHDAIRTRDPLDVELRIRSHSGQYRWFKSRSVLLSLDDGSAKWFGTNTDIDDQKRAEATLRQAHDQLERRVQERTRQLTELNASLQQEIDIRRSAEARLRERAEEIETLLDVLPVPVWIARDPECHTITGNRATYELLALPHGTNISRSAPPGEKTAFRVFHEGREVAPEDLPMQRAAALGVVVRNAVFDLVFDDGSCRSVFGLAAPLFDPNERVRGCIAVFVDITEIRRLEKGLQASEERFRSAFDYAPIGMALVAPDGKWLRVNRSLCELVGYSAEELLATDFQAITYPDDLDLDLSLVREVLDGSRQNYQMEKRYFHRQGRIIHVLLSVSLLRNLDGQPLYFVSQIEDISHRKEAELSLAANDALLRQFIKHSPAAIAMFDSNACYLQMSDRWNTDYSLSERNIVGMSHYDVFPDASDKWKEVHNRVLAGAVEKCDEDQYQRADGSLEWLQWECRPWYKAGGEVGGLIMFTQVITERKQIEAQTLASLREKEVLLKEIHHRVKNNLQIVSTLLDLQSDFTSDPAALQMFQESRGRVKSMSLIHERLYTSQDMARVNFSEYMRQLADDIYQTYKISSDVIQLDLDVEIPPMTIDIAIPCGLLLNELISNCFKHAFTHTPNGNVRVGLRRSSDGTNVFIVSDNGAGFPPNTDFRKTVSFGLQLVNMLVDQLNGDIEMVTGRGTTFTIRFPKITSSDKTAQRTEIPL